jgi:hypothetical protein
MARRKGEAVQLFERLISRVIEKNLSTAWPLGLVPPVSQEPKK